MPCKQSYYVGVFKHERTFVDGDVVWSEEEEEQRLNASSGKARADELNSMYRTPDRFYSARMVWE